VDLHLAVADVLMDFILLWASFLSHKQIICPVLEMLVEFASDFFTEAVFIDFYLGTSTFSHLPFYVIYFINLRRLNENWLVYERVMFMLRNLRFILESVISFFENC